MTENKKHMSFRYPESIEVDFKELYRLQKTTSKKNEALINAVKIAAALLRTHYSDDNLAAWEIIRALHKNIGVKLPY